MIIIKYADDESLINFLEYGTCKECNQINIEKDWCESYNSKRFQNFLEKRFKKYEMCKECNQIIIGDHWY